jgi:hypothetical protein
MIPKIIHYCWFGGTEIPDHDKKCIESWKKYCPDYEIKRWDESNYDFNKNQYMKEAYELKKWGFVPDYARLDIIYEYGGIYLDTDVELIRNIDDLLKNKAFMGFETNSEFVNPGLGFGAEKGFPLLKEIRDVIYGSRKFKREDGSCDTTPSPRFNTEFLQEKGLELNNKMQIIQNLKIYPDDYFCPIDAHSSILQTTEHTYSIHHFHASWLTKEEKISLIKTQKLVAKYGREKGEKIGRIVCFPYRVKMHLRTKGIKGLLKFAVRKIKDSKRQE